jgi:D-glycero-D-manno-heptose 1,7-bisphosphate phosphatase
MKKRAIFFDRDGTINVESGYISSFDQFRFFPGIVNALAKLRQSGWLLFIITNQSGIARGYFSIADVQHLHSDMQNKLKQADAAFDDIAICPHHKSGSVASLAIACECRKPGTKMLTDLANKWNIDLSASYVVGDKSSDVAAGNRAGLTSVLLRSGYGAGLDANALEGIKKPDHIFDRVPDFADWLLSNRSQ